MTDIAQEQASDLVRHLGEAASAVLSQIAGTELVAQPVSLDTATEAATLIRIELSGSLEGVCEIALSAAMTAQFAALLTGETPEPGAKISNDTREAAAELIQQICGNAADRLRRAFGPLELKPRLAERDAESGARQLFLITRENDAIEFELHILRLRQVVDEPAPLESAATQSATQAATQSGSQSPSAQPVTQPVTQPLNQPVTQPAASGASQSGNRNLDLLLDIELGVTLRFGTRQMLLKEIIELCSGSVVELDRRVQEPVDLLIDGRLIAQGEVVIVEGNYGLRILQVATPGEKLACLPQR
jgi:flagellar motor switch protein FliN/FliY